MKSWLTIALALGCGAPEPVSLARKAAPQAASAAHPGSAAASAPNPFAAHALPLEQRRWLEGLVVERLAAGSYVYLRVQSTDAASFWVASLALTTPSSPSVRVLVLGRADQFHSRRLGRDFSPLLFGAVRASESASLTVSKKE